MAACVCGFSCICGSCCGEHLQICFGFQANQMGWFCTTMGDMTPACCLLATANFRPTLPPQNHSIGPTPLGCNPGDRPSQAVHSLPYQWGCWGGPWRESWSYSNSISMIRWPCTHSLGFRPVPFVWAATVSMLRHPLTWQSVLYACMQATLLVPIMVGWPIAHHHTTACHKADKPRWCVAI